MYMHIVYITGTWGIDHDNPTHSPQTQKDIYLRSEQNGCGTGITYIHILNDLTVPTIVYIFPDLKKHRRCQMPLEVSFNEESLKLKLRVIYRMWRMQTPCDI